MTIGSIVLEKPNIMYLLSGETGEYDDHTMWVVGVFMSEDKAEERKEFLEKFLADHDIPNDTTIPCYYIEELETSEDPLLRVNWQQFGVEYSVDMVTILDA